MKASFLGIALATTLLGQNADGIACDIQAIQTIYSFVTDSVLPKFSGFF